MVVRTSSSVRTLLTRVQEANNNVAIAQARVTELEESLKEQTALAVQSARQARSLGERLLSTESSYQNLESRSQSLEAEIIDLKLCLKKSEETRTNAGKELDRVNALLKEARLQLESLRISSEEVEKRAIEKYKASKDHEDEIDDAIDEAIAEFKSDPASKEFMRDVFEKDVEILLSLFVDDLKRLAPGADLREIVYLQSFFENQAAREAGTGEPTAPNAGEGPSKAISGEGDGQEKRSDPQAEETARDGDQA